MHFLRFNSLAHTFWYTQVLCNGSKSRFGSQADPCSNPTPPLFSYVTLGELLCITKFISLSYRMSEIIIQIVGSNCIRVRQTKTWDHLLQRRSVYTWTNLSSSNKTERNHMGGKITACSAVGQLLDKRHKKTEKSLLPLQKS